MTLKPAHATARDTNRRHQAGESGVAEVHAAEARLEQARGAVERAKAQLGRHQTSRPILFPISASTASHQRLDRQPVAGGLSRAAPPAKKEEVMGTRADNKIPREYRRLVNLQIDELDWRYKRS